MDQNTHNLKQWAYVARAASVRGGLVITPVTLKLRMRHPAGSQEDTL